MKLLFVVSSLERGKNGVSDYTALLAENCFSLGTNCAILAWNDSLMTGNVHSSFLNEDAKDIPVVRLSTQISLPEKKKRAKEFISQFEPDRVSIQMVSFGFHPRGWIFDLGKTFNELFPRKPLIQIMFHETWLGFAKNHPWREKLYGILQKLALRSLWKTMSPSVVHVSNGVYFGQLKPFRLPLRYLPLLSNVPIHHPPQEEWIYEFTQLSLESRRESLVLLFFGSIHGGWELAHFFSKIERLYPGKKLVVFSVGKQGFGEAIWEKMQQYQNDRCLLFKFGFRTDDQISDLLQFADIGICTTPLSLLGKSGTATAMVQHGLPVIVTRNELTYSFPIDDLHENRHLVYLLKTLNTSEPLRRSSLQTDYNRQIAQKFLKDLSS